MAPLLISALTSLGPSLLRMLGGKKGGTAAIAAEAVASTIEKVTGSDKQTVDKSISEVVSSMPPEQRGELLSLLNEGERIKAELEGKKLETQRAEFQEEQTTHRAALASADIYTVRTRPLIARRSFYVGTGYVGASLLLPAFKVLVPEFSWEIYIALIAPALTYMGVRTFDKVISFRPTKLPGVK